MLTWLPQVEVNNGVALNSPATGQLLPVSAHPDLLYNTNVLTHALCIKLQHGTLRSPFNGVYDCRLLAGCRLRFRHSSGVTMQLDLPLPPAQKNTYSCVVLSGSKVTAGQAVMEVDLQMPGDCYAALMLLPHPAINAASSCSRFVEAAKDTAFIIQTLTKNST